VSDVAAALAERFGPDRVRADAPLRSATTFRTGGSAQWLFDARGSDEIVTALMLAGDAGVPVVLLGGGSNVLISDRGVRGLVIRPRGGEVRQAGGNLVRADAAVTMNGLVRWTITHNLAGVEAWAGTPGTVGGAVYGNAHFGGRLISEIVSAVHLCDRAGCVATVPVGDMGFGYDQSRLQSTGEVLLSADFRVSAGEAALLRETARRSLAYRKHTQPLDEPSAGCIFQNPQPGRDVLPEGFPWSAGALVDRAGMKGATVGGARVSLTHGNFIVNQQHATSTDIRRLIERCRAAVRARFGVELREEIVYLGDFSDALDSASQSAISD
jgi:UDP-N-acetylmuramate dehydrogenase